MVQEMAEDETWQPDKIVRTFWREYRKGQEYLKTLRELLSALSSPRPIREGIKPVSKGSANIKESNPSTSRATGACQGSDPPIERPADEKEALDGLVSLAKPSDADAKNGDGAGEDEAEGKEGPSDHKHTPKVVEKDQIEHELTGSGQEGLGTVRKGCKIHVEVREPIPLSNPLSLTQE